MIVRIPRQAGSRQHRIAFPRQNRYAIPGLLAFPDGVIPSVLYGTDGKLCLRRFQLLETNNVGFSGAEPVEEIGQSLADVIDVERRKLQRPCTDRNGLPRR